MANCVPNKGKSVTPHQFNGPKVLSSASDKVKLFVQNFSKNSNLDDSDISLPVFRSRTNLVVIKSCEPELSCILAELFNLCLKESCFPDCWKVLSVVPVCKC